jgi:ribosomal protein S18 acetylase RimI-like enzyme
VSDSTESAAAEAEAAEPEAAEAEAAEILERFDRQVRQQLVPSQTGWSTERVGRVIRTTSPAGKTYGCFVEWSDLDEQTADGEIAATVAYYAGLGRRFEWKTYAHDAPADLPARLLAAGFVAEDEEALVIGPVERVAAACGAAELPPGLVVREVTQVTEGTAADWDGIAALGSTVWGRESVEWVSALRDEVVDAPEAITVLVAVAGDEVVSAGWVRFHAGTSFASLWGGTTLPRWRRMGIYRALVGRRATLAADRGYAYLQVDASEDSRPILQRLGLRVLSTTNPYVWTPPA